jgi:hypothetical protein
MNQQEEFKHAVDNMTITTTDPLSAKLSNVVLQSMRDMDVSRLSEDVIKAFLDPTQGSETDQAALEQFKRDMINMVANMMKVADGLNSIQEDVNVD